MKQKQLTALSVRNIGGIEETEVTFFPGINVLVGRNATNRTSLLRAPMAALGSDQVSLKGDAERGDVELTLGSEAYSRTPSRGGVTFNGEPYLDPEHADVADFFAFLLETNEARQAVTRQCDLREVFMHPVDTVAIQNHIRELEREKQELDAELEDLNARKRKLPDLEQRRTSLERQIDEKREALAAKEAEPEAEETEHEVSPDEQSERDEHLEELRNTRAVLEEVRHDIDT